MSGATVSIIGAGPRRRFWRNTRSAVAGRNNRVDGSCRDATRRNRLATTGSRSAARSTLAA